jgi:4-diphosphocytidyl-2C-methyl-D-erythritol kinase
MDSIPFERTNACKVAEAFRKKYQTSGVEITIYENIPVGAGLGGSSADSAGVLRALCKLYDIPIADVYEIANQYGSDIRYMLEGGFARMQGKGEIIQPLEEKKRLHFLLLCPNSTVSAGECYKKYDELGCSPMQYTEKAIRAYQGGDLETLGKLLCNDLFAPANALNADLGTAYEELLSFSPLGVCMTGSGSCVFALFESKELCEWAKSRYKGRFRAIVSSTLDGGFGKVVKNPFAL